MKIFTKSIVPNLLTLANLFSGFSAIIAISDNDYNLAAIYIMLAAVFDMFDGMTARLINAASEFGVQLDSLCDAVSFGVAPAYMLYELYFNELGSIGVLLASLPALAGVVRLASFNVNIHSLDDKDYFTGLPIPSSAITIVSYVIFFHNSSLVPAEWQDMLIISIPIFTSISMVSLVKFDNLPKPTKSTMKRRPFVLIIFILGVIGAIITQGKLIFPFMMLYILGSFSRYLFLRKPKNIDEFDEEEI